MNGQNVICPCNGIFSQKGMCYNVNEPWKHAEWEKLVRKSHMLYNSICMKCLDEANSERQKVD